MYLLFFINIGGNTIAISILNFFFFIYWVTLIDFFKNIKISMMVPVSSLSAAHNVFSNKSRLLVWFVNWRHFVIKWLPESSVPQ